MSEYWKHEYLDDLSNPTKAAMRGALVPHEWVYSNSSAPLMIAGLPRPERSSQDKVLDDFIAKRKAKREQPQGSGWVTDVTDVMRATNARSFDDEVKQWRQSRALGCAMSRPAPHHTDIHERLMPYRGPSANLEGETNV